MTESTQQEQRFAPPEQLAAEANVKADAYDDAAPGTRAATSACTSAVTGPVWPPRAARTTRPAAPTLHRADGERHGQYGVVESTLRRAVAGTPGADRDDRTQDRRRRRRQGAGGVA